MNEDVHVISRAVVLLRENNSIFKFLRPSGPSTKKNLFCRPCLLTTLHEYKSFELYDSSIRKRKVKISCFSLYGFIVRYSLAKCQVANGVVANT